MDKQAAFQQLQLMEQNLQMFTNQKQQFAVQQAEIEVALSEIEKTAESYKIVGNIMVKADKAVLVAELNSKKEVLALRIQSLEKQEKRLRENAEALQREFSEQMAKEKPAQKQ